MTNRIIFLALSVIATQAMHASAQSTGTCAYDSLDALASRCASVRQAPSGRRTIPVHQEQGNPGTAAVPGHLIDGAKEDIEKKLSKKPKGPKKPGVGGIVERIADPVPSPGETLCLLPAPMRQYCQVVVDTSWPESISKRQGTSVPEYQDREAGAIDRGECFPRGWPKGTTRSGPMPSVPPPACQSAEELVPRRAELAEAQERLSREQHEDWLAGRQYASFVDNVIGRAEPLTRDGRLTRRQQRALDLEVWKMKLEQSRLSSRGITPVESGQTSQTNSGHSIIGSPTETRRDTSAPSYRGYDDRGSCDRCGSR